MSTETKLTPIERLKGCCMPGIEDPHLRHAMFSQPLHISWDKEDWTVASDGVFLLAIAGKHCDYTHEKSARILLDILSREAAELFTTRAGDLISWAGAPPDRSGSVREKCESCDGSGFDTCPHCEQTMDCEECDGRGEAIPLFTWGRECAAISECSFILERIAWLLRGSEDNACVQVSISDGLLILRSEFWLASIMEVKGKATHHSFEEWRKSHAH